MWLVSLAIDDALYYPVIARNIVRGLGSTYDGLTQTNGYHPLWCWLQIPIAAVFRNADTMTFLWFVKLLIAATVGTALAVWARLLLRVTGCPWMTATFTVLLGAYPWSVFTLYGGMETALVVLLMGMTLTLALRLFAVRTAASAFLFGTTLAACFLARLDSVFFVVLLGLAVLLRIGSDLRTQAMWVAPAVAFVAPYLIWNTVKFGGPMPVSGMRKTVSDPDIGQQVSNFLDKFAQPKFEKIVGLIHPVGAVLFAFAIVAALLMLRARIAATVRSLGILWVLPAAATLHLLYAVIFMTEAHVNWYQYAEYLTAFLAASVLVSAAAAGLGDLNLGSRIKWLPFGAVYAAVLAMLVSNAASDLRKPTNLGNYQAGIWAREHLQPKELRFGMIDPGVFRIASGFDTVALNALAGDRRMMMLHRDRNKAEIVRSYDIDYVVVFAVEKDVPTIPAEYVVYRSPPVERYQVGQGRIMIVKPEYWNGKRVFGPFR
jgi:hypothetical protein